MNLGYPKLLARQSELRSVGVDFTDLRGIFRDVKEIAYRDSCCHLNEFGGDLVARAIVRHITELRRRAPEAT